MVLLEPLVDLELSLINSFVRRLCSCLSDQIRYGKASHWRVTIFANLFGFVSSTCCGFDDYEPFFKASFAIGLSFTSMFLPRKPLLIYLILRCNGLFTFYPWDFGLDFCGESQLL